jgi:hypothetical protein
VLRPNLGNAVDQNILVVDRREPLDARDDFEPVAVVLITLDEQVPPWYAREEEMVVRVENLGCHSSILSAQSRAMEYGMGGDSGIPGKAGWKLRMLGRHHGHAS